MTRLRIDIYFLKVDVLGKRNRAVKEDGAGDNPPVRYKHIDISSLIDIPKNCSFKVYRNKWGRMQGFARIKQGKKQLRLTDILLIPSKLEKKGFRFNRNFDVKPYLLFPKGTIFESSSTSWGYRIRSWKKDIVEEYSKVIKKKIESFANLKAHHMLSKISYFEIL